MAGLIDAQEREIAVLADLPILSVIDLEGGVACGAELLRVRVVQSKGDGLATKPVADIICLDLVYVIRKDAVIQLTCITIVESYSQASI